MKRVPLEFLAPSSIFEYGENRLVKISNVQHGCVCMKYGEDVEVEPFFLSGAAKVRQVAQPRPSCI